MQRLGSFYYYKVLTLSIQMYYPLKSGQKEWMIGSWKEGKWNLKMMH